MEQFLIDVEEKFPHLPKAPIVEAVVDIRTNAEAPWEEANIQNQLKKELPDYPKIMSQRKFTQEIKIGLGLETGGKQSFHDLGWNGCRLQSKDQLNIAQFNRDGFVFSRLMPYENWEQLTKERMRLWDIYISLAHPSGIQRIGLRFINKIVRPMSGLKLEDYYKNPPNSPEGLDFPFAGFMHHDTLMVPGYPYKINIIKTIQNSLSAEKKDIGLIVDIDVFTNEPFSLQKDDLDKRLSEMRWLKNKIFFGSITQKTLELFK